MAEAPHPTSHSVLALKKLQDHLTCPVCLEAYTDPRVLLCNHAFCRGCLENLAKRSADGVQAISTVECPNCRKQTRFAEIGDLQKAFYLEGLFEIKRDLEASCELGTGQKSTKCEAHKMAVDLYCKTCKQFLCNACTFGDHKLHSFDKISLVAHEETAKLEAKLESLDSKVLCIEAAMSDLENNVCRAQDEESRIKNEIRESCRQAREALNEREKDLIKQLNQMTEQKLHNISVRKAQLQLGRSQLKSCGEGVRESLRIESPTESLKVTQSLIPMMDDVTQFCYELTTGSSCRQAHDIAFHADTSTVASLSGYGKVYVKVPDAENCLAEGEGLSRAKVGEVAEVELSLYDQHRLVVCMEAAVHTINAEIYSLTESDLPSVRLKG